MSATLPLIAGYHPQAILAWREGQPVTQGEFAAQALALARSLPDQAYAINLCEDRYRFMLALCALCLRGQTSLLPASGISAATDVLLERYPGSYLLTDDCVQILSARAPVRAPRIAAEHVAAIAFTSGSTGQPQAHAKTWRVLMRTASLARRVFLPGAATVNIVATVPPQHMYGLETSVFFALAGGCASHHGRPFFPADLRDTLAQVPPPRLLITTPVHLRAVVAAGIKLPELQLAISATAPLSPTLAQQAETVLRAPLREIYGCTEAGSMASRRPAESEQWQLHPRMRVERAGDVAIVHGAHLPQPVAVSDQIELQGRRRFRLLGRNADLLKVAGKRVSLADLTQKLLALPGVEDGILFMPDGAERPAALVVAPALEVPEILAALAAQVDAVFLPRPMRKVDRLPRNELGKLPREQLMALIQP